MLSRANASNQKCASWVLEIKHIQIGSTIHRVSFSFARNLYTMLSRANAHNQKMCFLGCGNQALPDWRHHPLRDSLSCPESVHNAVRAKTRDRKKTCRLGSGNEAHPYWKALSLRELLFCRKSVHIAVKRKRCHREL